MKKLHFEPLNGKSLLENVLITTAATAHHSNNGTTVSYCGAVDSLTDIWHDGGLSKCFYFTLSSILLMVLTAPVCVQITKMKKLVV